MLPLGKQLWAWGRRTAIMGILNITPDSFSADGLATPGVHTVETALAKAHAMQAAGADWLDIGGQSTRPGHALIRAEEELDRVLPVIEALHAAGLGPISVDTFRLPVAEAALAVGAVLVNSVWGLAYDPGLAALATTHAAPLVLLHNRSRPASNPIGPNYPPHLAAVTPLQADDDPVAVVSREMAEQPQSAQAAGVPRWLLISDPGLGFGKHPTQSRALLRHLNEVKARAGQPWIPLVAGVSRKGFIGYEAGSDGQPLPTDQRLEGTLAACALAVERGVDILRVHDVQAVTRAVRFTEATLAAG
jgi:dihydropteroate synthase